MFLLVAWWTKSELVISLVIPWTTIPTQLAAYAMIYLYLARSPSWRLVVALTALDGFAYLCRPGDGVFLAPLVLAAVVEVPGSIRRKLSMAGAGLVLVLVFVVFDRAVNMAVFDRALSSYERGVLDDFFAFGMAQRAYVLMVDAMPVFRTDEPMLGRRLPYLLFVGPGLWLFVLRMRWKAVAPLAAVVLGIGLYLSYDKFRPDALFKFHIVHYVAWLFPLAGLAAYATASRAWARMGTLTYTTWLVVPLAAFAFLRLEERPGPFARIGADGTLVPAQGQWEDDAAYDVAVAGDASRRFLWLRGKSTAVETSTADGVEVLHFGKPMTVSRIRAPHPADIGATFELRRLEWGLASIPAWLERGEGGTTVPPPRLPLRAELGGWKKIEHQVGRIDGKSRAIVTDGTEGMLQHGGAMRLPHGRYVVAWNGVCRAAGRIVLTIADARRGEALGRDVVDLEIGNDTLLGALEFRVRGGPMRVEPRMYVFEGVELDLHRIEIWRWSDWEAAHGGEP
jgi:hypothetical protein